MSFTPEQIAKLTKVIQEGVQVKREIDDLNVGLKETVAAIAEEMEILNKGEMLEANRFDFTFQDNYYLHNIELDEKGEVLRCNEAV